MADISSVAQSPYAPSTTTQTTSTPNGTIGKDDFMKLLVAQLSHQDPLEPSDPSQFVSQLSQFSSLEQLVNMKEGLDLLAITETAGTSAQMVSFIGKTVEFDGVGVPWKEGGTPAVVNWETTKDAAKVTVTVTDSKGSVVRKDVLGEANAGAHSYQFDGLDDQRKALPDGTYSVTITAETVDGDAIPVTQKSTGVVTGVTFANGYPQLMLADGRTIGLAQVIQILDGALAAAAAQPAAEAEPVAEPAANPEPHSGASAEDPFERL